MNPPVRAGRQAVHLPHFAVLGLSYGIPILKTSKLSRDLRKRSHHTHMKRLLTYQNVLVAARRIVRYVRRTPVIDLRLQSQYFFKCENLQRAGTFKYRGAVNALSRIGEKQRKAGVLAASSGNHAEAIALTA